MDGYASGLVSVRLRPMPLPGGGQNVVDRGAQWRPAELAADLYGGRCRGRWRRPRWCLRSKSERLYNDPRQHRRHDTSDDDCDSTRQDLIERPLLDPGAALFERLGGAEKGCLG